VFYHRNKDLSFYRTGTTTGKLNIFYVLTNGIIKVPLELLCIYEGGYNTLLGSYPED
jgi:hypothetical protein